MKKQFLFTLYTLLSIGFLILGLYFGLANTSEWVAVISGVIIMIISVPIYQMGKTTRFLYYVTIIMNSIATGLVISAYYTYFGQAPILDTSILIGLLVTLIASLTSFLAFYIKESKHKKLITLFLILIAYGVTIPLWMTLDDIFYSQFFFFMHTCYFLLISIISLKEKDTYLKSSALSTYGVAAVITFIVLIIISEGEVLEGVGYFGDTKSNKANQIKG